jgi:hypothetical protein
MKYKAAGTQARPYSRATSLFGDVSAAGKPHLLEVGMSRFSIGEIAIYEYDPNCIFHAAQIRREARMISGCECVIQSVLFFCDRQKASCYYVRMNGDDWTVEEQCLRKRPQPGDYKSTLIPCDRQFPAVLDRWLNPAPATLEARMQRVFPSVGEINRGRV